MLRRRLVVHVTFSEREESAGPQKKSLPQITRTQISCFTLLLVGVDTWRESGVSIWFRALTYALRPKDLLSSVRSPVCRRPTRFLSSPTLASYTKRTASCCRRASASTRRGRCSRASSSGRRSSSPRSSAPRSPRRHRSGRPRRRQLRVAIKSQVRPCGVLLFLNGCHSSSPRSPRRRRSESPRRRQV